MSENNIPRLTLQGYNINLKVSWVYHSCLPCIGNYINDDKEKS